MYEIIRTLVVPPALPILILFFGLLAMKKRPRAGVRAAWAGLALLYLCSISPVSSRLIGAVEMAPAPGGPVWTGAGAIVVLSAGVDRDAVEYGGETVDAASLVRVRYAAKLHRETGLPLLVTGGRMPLTDGSIAAAMKTTLERDFAVPVTWVEDRAQTTAENAAYSAELLKPAGITKIVLISEAYHLARSIPVFVAAGLEVIPAPTAVRSDFRWHSAVLIPNAAALRDSYFALHEMIGRIWYRLRGFA